MTAAKKKKLLARIAELLDDPTCCIEWSRGKREITEPGDMNRRFEATGLTLSIHIQGGAVDMGHP